MSSPEITPIADSTMSDSAKPEGMDRVTIPVELESNVIAFPVRHEKPGQGPHHLEYDQEHSDNVTELDSNDINLRASHMAVQNSIDELQDLKHREASRQMSLLGDERDRKAEVKSEAAFDRLERQTEIEEAALAKESLIRAGQNEYNQSVADAGRRDVLDLSDPRRLAKPPVLQPNLGARRTVSNGNIFDKGRTKSHE